MELIVEQRKKIIQSRISVASPLNPFKNGMLIEYPYFPTKEDFGKCLDYAKQVQLTTQYASDRNQGDPEVEIRQAQISKIAEVAAQTWASEDSYGIIKAVDFEIYSAKNKSYDSDLTIESKIGDAITTSIKTSMRRRGGRTEHIDGVPIKAELPPQHSYTIQRSNATNSFGGTDKGDYHVYIFCNWEEDAQRIDVYAAVRAEIVEEMFIEPFKEIFKGRKKCIMQKTCGGERPFPCGIDELLKERDMIL